jgi:hypothetical protein
MIGITGLLELREGLPAPIEKQRHQIPKGYRVSAKPILAGLHRGIGWRRSLPQSEG